MNANATEIVDESGRKVRPFTGWHMLAIILGFFAVVLSVNIFMATQAIRHWTGLVVQNSYVASQKFDENTQRLEAQAKLNWRANLTYDGGLLAFQLADAEGIDVDLSSVEVSLARPVGVSEDQQLSLTQGNEGFALRTKIPHGVWNVLVHAQPSAGPAFEWRARLIVGASNS